jgi:hypothetical protein
MSSAASQCPRRRVAMVGLLAADSAENPNRLEEVARTPLHAGHVRAPKSADDSRDHSLC